MENENTNTVEIAEPENTVIPEKKSPTRDELKASGWSKPELDAAEKRGMIDKPKEQPEVKAEVKTDAKAEPKAEEGKDAKPEAVEERRKEERNGALPDFTITDPNKEKVFLDTFGPGTPQRAMYFRMKNERQQRQAAEAKSRQLEEEIALLKGRKPVQPEVDSDGNEIDPDDKPMTPKMFREMQAKEAEERNRLQQEHLSKAERNAAAVHDQEEYAKSVYPDFEDTVKLAGEVMQNLDSLIPEKWKRDEAIELIKQLQIRANNATEYEIDSLTPAMIAYRIGELHPNKGKTSNGKQAEPQTDGNSDRPETKANGSHTPEQMKRIEANTQRRASSASIPGGGGSRTVSADDVTLKVLNDMSPTQRASFKTKHPDKYSKLLRG